MRSIWKNGGFPANQRGRVCVFQKKSQSKERFNAILFYGCLYVAMTFKTERERYSTRFIKMDRKKPARLNDEKGEEL